jgi:hypothetical protein
MAGATASPWFGFSVHRNFKTLIIQNENGRYRLQKKFPGWKFPNWIIRYGFVPRCPSGWPLTIPNFVPRFP